jgi:hypothetical protein
MEDTMPTDDWSNRLSHYRERVKEQLRQKGFVPAEDGFIDGKNLQWEWRKQGCRRDPSEIMLAILDALTQEGVPVWPGDATSCVEQIVRVQYDRAEAAYKKGWNDGLDELVKVLRDPSRWAAMVTEMNKALNSISGAS